METIFMPNFDLELEEKAFLEIKQILGNRYSTPDLTRLKEENQAIENNLQKENIALGEYYYDFPLIEDIFKFYLSEPMMYRVIVHNRIPPEDIETRAWLRKKFISEEDRKYYLLSLGFESVLKDSDLARTNHVRGLPIHLFMIGKVLHNLHGAYNHFRMIDEVKNSGALESIEELRGARFYSDAKETIYDYSPIYKDTIFKSQHCLTRECFRKEDFEKPVDNDEIDSLLFPLMQRTHGDYREEEFRGNLSVDPEKFKFIIKCGTEEKEPIPLQALPKYMPLIRKLTKKVPRRDRHDTEDKAIMLFLEAVLGVSYRRKNTQRKRGGENGNEQTADKEIPPPLLKPTKMPWASFIQAQLRWRLGNEWDCESTEALKKGRKEQLRWQYIQSTEEDVEIEFKKQERIGYEKMEHSGGSLDEFIASENKAGRRIDCLDIKNNKDPDSEIMILEKARKDKRLWSILESGEARTVADQKYFERKIKEIRVAFGINPEKGGE